MRTLLIILAVFPLACLAESEKDFATVARESNAETVKRYCVGQWTEPSANEILSKVSSVAELCGCVQDEMKFAVSDDLSIRLLKAQAGHQAGELNKYLTEDERLRTFKEWGDHYNAASRSCKESVIRRRNQR